MNGDTPSSGSKQNLISGKLCLDFANTAEWHASEHPEEKLRTYNDLIKWAHLAGLISERESQKLSRKASRESSEAEKVLGRALELREAIYHVFSTIDKGNRPQNEDMAVINMNLSRTMVQSRLVHSEKGFIWITRRDELELDCMLDPIVRSAAELLTSHSIDRVKECADDRGCGYLFLDNSRNRSRRWCDMADCGNRAKAKRYYRKQRKAQLTAS